jgi:hypothetical protein
MVDLDMLNNPARGGFNLTYNDGWFAQRITRKWGMSSVELAKAVEKIKATLPPNEIPKLRIVTPTPEPVNTEQQLVMEGIA